jgi:hypothetical protein
MPFRSLFKSKSVNLLVDSLYAEVIDVVWSRAALSSNTSELISTQVGVRSEARFWNRSKSLNFSSGSKSFESKISVVWNPELRRQLN